MVKLLIFINLNYFRRSEQLQNNKKLPWGQGEVHQCNFGGYLWGVVRVGQLCCDIEFEILMIWYYSVSQFNHETSGLSEGLF